MESVRRTRVLAFFGVILLVAVSACTSDALSGSPTSEPAPTSERKHRVAAVETALSPPGTEVVAGIEVQQGSFLVGPAFPLTEVRRDADTGELTREKIGWQAVFLVDGDAEVVWDRYVKALDLGDDDLAEHRCSVVPVVLPDSLGEDAPDEGLSAPGGSSTASLDAENQQIRCGGGGMVMKIGLGNCLQYRGVEVKFCVRQAVSHLYVTIRDAADETPFPPTGTGVSDGFETVTDLPSRLPGPGDRYDDGLDPFLNDTPIVDLAPGARSLIAPAMLIDCGSGLVAVVDFPGDPEAAISSFGRSGDEQSIVEPTTGMAYGRRWAGASQPSVGGYGIGLTAVDTGDGRSAVLITECGD